METYVGIDIGGTSIKYGLLDKTGVILQKGSRATEAEKGGAAILEKTIDIVEQFRKEHPVSGICISTAGMVDTEKGEIFYSAPLIPDYAGTDFKRTLESRFSVRCEVENDVNCAGLAEAVSGAAAGSRAALMLTVGTGIGGCILLDGHVYHGSGGSAGEVGYLEMDGSDFQTLGAASILSKKVAACKGEDASKWPGRRIFELAKAGDEDCVRAIDEMTDVLGRGIASICCVMDPEVVVLGGGIMEQKEFLYPRISAAMKRHMNPMLLQHTRLAFAHYGNDAGMLGAFYHFMQKKEQ